MFLVTDPKEQATTNKSSWPGVVGYGPNTTWVPRARWVEDDSADPPIWSSSGVTSGFDLTFHFVEKFYGAENASMIAQLTEYVRNTDKDNDPFARNETVVR
jgi:transcriptional regulator GlxA family with amidase domain